jgi:hypothetical protein
MARRPAPHVRLRDVRCQLVGRRHVDSAGGGLGHVQDVQLGAAGVMSAASVDDGRGIGADGVYVRHVRSSDVRESVRVIVTCLAGSDADWGT